MILGQHSYFLGSDHGIGTVIGNYTSIGEDCLIHTLDNRESVYKTEIVCNFDFCIFGSKINRSGMGHGSVIIGNDVWIGRGVKILSGVKIGDGAIIGAHSVVAKEVLPYAVVVGNPIVIKRYRFSPEIIKALLKNKWWDWGEEIIKDRLDDFGDINTFIKKYDKG